MVRTTWAAVALLASSALGQEVETGAALLRLELGVAGSPMLIDEARTRDIEWRLRRVLGPDSEKDSEAREGRALRFLGRWSTETRKSAADSGVPLVFVIRKASWDPSQTKTEKYRALRGVERLKMRYKGGVARVDALLYDASRNKDVATWTIKRDLTKPPSYTRAPVGAEKITRRLEGTDELDSILAETIDRAYSCAVLYSLWTERGRFAEIATSLPLSKYPAFWTAVSYPVEPKPVVALMEAAVRCFELVHETVDPATLSAFPYRSQCVFCRQPHADCGCEAGAAMAATRLGLLHVLDLATTKGILDELDARLPTKPYLEASSLRALKDWIAEIEDEHAWLLNEVLAPDGRKPMQSWLRRDDPSVRVKVSGTKIPKLSIQDPDLRFATLGLLVRGPTGSGKKGRPRPAEAVLAVNRKEVLDRARGTSIPKKLPKMTERALALRISDYDGVR